MKGSGQASWGWGSTLIRQPLAPRGAIHPLHPHRPKCAYLGAQAEEASRVPGSSSC